MGLFRTHKEPTYNDLLRELAALKSDFAVLRLEWTGVLDKVLHRLQRQAKRDRDAVVAETSESPGTGNGSPAAPVDPRAARALRRAELYQRMRR